MPHEFEGWILLVIFVVIPVLRWIFEKVLSSMQSSGTPGRTAEKKAIDEEDPLPEWFDGQVWEKVSDSEEAGGRISARVESDVGPPVVIPPSTAPAIPRVSRLPREQSISGSVLLPLPHSTGLASRSETEPPRASKPGTLLSRPFSREELQRAVLFSEILGKPRSLNPFSGGNEGGSA